MFDDKTGMWLMIVGVALLIVGVGGLFFVRLLPLSAQVICCGLGGIGFIWGFVRDWRAYLKRTYN